MKKSAKLHRSADNAFIVRVGRQVENISADKTKAELFEAVKWALIGMDMYLSDVDITELIQSAERR